MQWLLLKSKDCSITLSLSNSSIMYIGRLSAVRSFQANPLQTLLEKWYQRFWSFVLYWPRSSNNNGIIVLPLWDQKHKWSSIEMHSLVTRYTEIHNNFYKFNHVDSYVEPRDGNWYCNVIFTVLSLFVSNSNFPDWCIHYRLWWDNLNLLQYCIS